MLTHLAEDPFQVFIARGNRSCEVLVLRLAEVVESLHLLDVFSDAVEQAIGLQRSNLDLAIFAELISGEQLADVRSRVLQLLPLEMILKLFDGHLFLSELVQLVAEHFHID